MTRLRRVFPDARGWTRRRVGRGFTYLDADGRRLPAQEVARIRALVIPPAWNEVWVSPVANGHIQAVGTDAAGRRQYLYHPDWRAQRDQQKFVRITEAALRLPAMRKRVLADLALPGMPLERATATAVRLLDLGYFRIGSDIYAEDNGSFGLTTLERSHLHRSRAAFVFEFVGKSGIEHHIEIDDQPAVTALESLRRRRSGSSRLLAYKVRGTWRDLDASTVNDYLGSLSVALTAKDFRTWHATVLAADALARTAEHGRTLASRKRAVAAAAKEVSGYLGNTPTIARTSYIDPRVVDRYHAGSVLVMARRFRDPGRHQASLERALHLLLGARS